LFKLATGVLSAEVINISSIKLSYIFKIIFQ